MKVEASSNTSASSQTVSTFVATGHVLYITIGTPVDWYRFGKLVWLSASCGPCDNAGCKLCPPFWRLLKHFCDVQSVEHDQLFRFPLGTLKERQGPAAEALL